MTLNLEQLNQRINALENGDTLRVDDLPDATYHASIGIGSSMMKEYLKSPAHFDHAKRAPFKASPAMLLGSLVHSLVLRPEELANYEILPSDFNARTKAGKELKSSIEESGKVAIAPNDYAIAQRISEQVLGDFKSIFDEGTPEVSFWRRISAHVVLKARIDFVGADGAFYDLKTTSKSATDFEYNANSFGYYFQAAHYLFVSDVDTTFGFIVAETIEPYLTAGVYQYEADTLAWARERVINAAHEMEMSFILNHWPGYKIEEHRLTMRLPEYRRH